MYDRVAAIQVGAAPTWQWKSTVPSSLSTLFHFLRLFRAFPKDRLRVFSSSSREGLAEQLAQENQGLASTSVTAAQFLCERMLRPPTVVRSICEREGETERERGAIAVISQPAVNKRGGEGSVLESRGMSPLERRWEELESGPEGDHDLPYSISLLLSAANLCLDDPAGEGAAGPTAPLGRTREEPQQSRKDGILVRNARKRRSPRWTQGNPLSLEKLQNERSTSHVN